MSALFYAYSIGGDGSTEEDRKACAAGTVKVSTTYDTNVYFLLISLEKECCTLSLIWK